MKWPKNVLMCPPSYFDIEYAINPHMLDSDGELNSINSELALLQWSKLKEKFEELGLNVHTIEPQKNLPDMVFTANQTLPYQKNGKTNLILSRMNYTQREPEVEYFKNWAEKNNIQTYELKTEESFEGMGDALWNYETEELFGGAGFRTSEVIYDEVKKVIEKPIHILNLINIEFYHLDTCLAIANKDTAFVVKEGFDDESFEVLKTHFKNLIEIPLDEARTGFAANLCCVNGTDIIIQKDNPQTCAEAKKHGLKIHEVDTSEFIKSGGSVFCMKQLF